MAQTCWRMTGGQRVMFRFTRAGCDRYNRQQYLVYVYLARHGRPDRVLFSGGPYTPSPRHADNTRTWVSDVVGFAVAYVERPEEFDRAADDKEQLEAAWWRTHGDMLACAND